MSRLIALIDAYKDSHGGPSDSSVARAIGVAPQTISSWRQRGIKQLPDRDTLQALARLMSLDYESVVLRAVLLDIGWLEESDGDADAAPTSTVTDLSEALGRVAGEPLERVAKRPKRKG